MYLYHAHAVALGGIAQRPVSQTTGALASCSLAMSGGTSSASESKFDNGLISFDSAKSDLTGSVETRGGSPVYVTGVSVIVNGLNIRNVIMADQVVLRVAAEHIPPPAAPSGSLCPSWPEPSIITTGCHFDNLKIAGHPVTLDMVHDVFHALPTYRDCQTDWTLGAPSKLRPTLMGGTIPSMGGTILLPPGSTAPPHLQQIHDGYVDQCKLPNLKPCVICSFVQKASGIAGAEIDNWHSIVRIPQFGTIYLGEVIICPGHRRVNMFRLHMGSPDDGDYIGPSGGSNGTGYP